MSFVGCSVSKDKKNSLFKHKYTAHLAFRLHQSVVLFFPFVTKRNSLLLYWLFFYFSPSETSSRESCLLKGFIWDQKKILHSDVYEYAGQIPSPTMGTISGYIHMKSPSAGLNQAYLSPFSLFFSDSVLLCISVGLSGRLVTLFFLLCLAFPQTQSHSISASLSFSFSAGPLEGSALRLEWLFWNINEREDGVGRGDPKMTLTRGERVM